VVVGEYRGEESPALVRTPLAAFEVAVRAGAGFTLRTRSDFEYGVVAVDGPATVAGAHIEPGLLAHVPAGMTSIRLVAAEGGRDPVRFFVIGGEPFTEHLLMWWNFVARTAEEITQARDEWAAGQFAPVRGYAGDPLPAPDLPAGRLRPR
jgi:redox-sensitive bicupin YhaK (pirin superfamily)